MPIPSTIADLDSDPSGNYPKGSDEVGTTVSDYIRAGFSIQRQMQRSESGIQAANTLEVSPDAVTFYVEGSGVDVYAISDRVIGGEIRIVFKEAGVKLVSGGGLSFPTGLTSITTLAGDNGEFVNDREGHWTCMAYHRADGSTLYVQGYVKQGGDVLNGNYVFNGNLTAASLTVADSATVVITGTGPVALPATWRGKTVYVSAIGGGGGGGAGASGSDVGSGGGGGGGGAGVWTTIAAVIPMGLETLYAVIGQGGAGGQLGGFKGGDGTEGSSTTLFDKQQEPRAVLATALGGSLGQGAGGIQETGVTYPGAGGCHGGSGGGLSVNSVLGAPGNGGAGGSSPYGSGGRHGARSGISGSPGYGGGTPPSNTGAGGGGGGGGLGDSTQSARTNGGTGGAGSSGLIIIKLTP